MFMLLSKDSPSQTSNEVQAPKSLGAWKHRVSVYPHGWWKMQSWSLQLSSLLSIFSHSFSACDCDSLRHLDLPVLLSLNLRSPNSLKPIGSLCTDLLGRSVTHWGVPRCPSILCAQASSPRSRRWWQWWGRVGGRMNTQGSLARTYCSGSLHPQPRIQKNSSLWS